MGKSIYTKAERERMERDEARASHAKQKHSTHREEIPPHPAALIFPLMEGAEYAALVEDIKTNGLRDPIVRFKDDGKQWILDGRNRLRACHDAGVKPQFDDYVGKDPIAYAMSKNVHRRHLNETQRAFVGAELVPLYEEQAKERMLAGKASPSLNIGEGRSGKSAEHAARAVNVSRASVESALKVNRDGDPEVIAAAKERGELAVSAAAVVAKLPKAKQRAVMKKMEKKSGGMKAGSVRAYAKQEEKRIVAAQINAEPQPMPEGPFRVIVSDPPWDYTKRAGDATHRSDLPYPSMSTDAICAIEVGKLAHDEGCVLWLWTTNAFMRDAYRVLDAWGFQEKTILTWVKDRFVNGDWLRGQTEHCILAVRGKPPFGPLTNETTVLHGPLREHSRKPDEFYALVEKLCPGAKVEMFCRQPRPNWAKWGAETEKFNAS
jgi:N6-adenosine-specific RNA methylase IME4/ParB-like chromosome segregation protein Spo0J